MRRMSSLLNVTEPIDKVWQNAQDLKFKSKTGSSLLLADCSNNWVRTALAKNWLRRNWCSDRVVNRHLTSFYGLPLYFKSESSVPVTGFNKVLSVKDLFGPNISASSYSNSYWFEFVPSRTDKIDCCDSSPLNSQSLRSSDIKAMEFRLPSHFVHNILACLGGACIYFRSQSLSFQVYWLKCQNTVRLQQFLTCY